MAVCANGKHTPRPPSSRAATPAAALGTARIARRRAQALRGEAAARRARALEQRWDLWSRGSLPEPPSRIPATWEAAPHDDLAVADRMATECAQAAKAILRLAARRGERLPAGVAARVPAVVALCEVTAERLADRSLAEGFSLARACVQAFGALERAVEAAAASERDVALAVTARASSRALQRGLATIGVLVS